MALTTIHAKYMRRYLQEGMEFLSSYYHLRRGLFFFNFLLETVKKHSIFVPNHPHDDPRTWIRGRVAPHGLKPVGFFFSGYEPAGGAL